MIPCYGTGGFTADHAEALRKTRRVFLAFDNDEAGENGAKKLALTEDGSGLVTDPGRPTVPYQTFIHLRMKTFGAVCIRSNGDIAEAKGGSRNIVRRHATKELVLVIAGATGVWLKGNAPPPLLPTQAASAREFGVDGTACFFDVGGGMGVVPTEVQAGKREIRRLTFDGDAILDDGSR